MWRISDMWRILDFLLYRSMDNGLIKTWNLCIFKGHSESVKTSPLRPFLAMFWHILALRFEKMIGFHSN